MFKVLGAVIAAAFTIYATSADAAIVLTDTAKVQYGEGVNGVATITRPFDWQPDSIFLQPGSTYEVTFKLDAGAFDISDISVVDVLKIGRIDGGQFFTDYDDVIPQGCPSNRCELLASQPGKLRYRFSTVSLSEIDPWPTQDTAFVYGVDAGFAFAFDILAPGFEHVTLTTTLSAVPEPRAWAILIVGFGIAGAALRRRQPSPHYA